MIFTAINSNIGGGGGGRVTMTSLEYQLRTWSNSRSNTRGLFPVC